MEPEVAIGLGVLTLIGATFAICMTDPKNRIPFAIHIAVVNGLAYIVTHMK